MFDGKQVIKRIYTPEELRQQAEVKKSKLLEEAETVIAPLARAVKRNIATDEEIKQLEAWELYSVLVSRVDTSKSWLAGETSQPVVITAVMQAT
ncbi:Phage tail fiber [Salmonella enterica subsp. arizonae]|nr:Phage tail fiber [Salmonella enterica subsp. arizonae]